MFVLLNFIVRQPYYLLFNALVVSIARLDHRLLHHAKQDSIVLLLQVKSLALLVIIVLLDPSLKQDALRAIFALHYRHLLSTAHPETSVQLIAMLPLHVLQEHIVLLILLLHYHVLQVITALLIHLPLFYVMKACIARLIVLWE